LFPVGGNLLDEDITPHIAVRKVWADEDMVELEVLISDGRSRFFTKVYVGHKAFESVIAELEILKNQIHGGIYDLRFGEFGSEYATGAFQARLHFYPSGRGQLCITASAESEWYPFAKTEVASRATLYLKSEPGMLDYFIRELKRVQSGSSEVATFQCL
jgi:hypothetical protein